MFTKLRSEKRLSDDSSYVRIVFTILIVYLGIFEIFMYIWKVGNSNDNVRNGRIITIF